MAKSGHYGKLAQYLHEKLHRGFPLELAMKSLVFNRIPASFEIDNIPPWSDNYYPMSSLPWAHRHHPFLCSLFYECHGVRIHILVLTKNK